MKRVPFPGGKTRHYVVAVEGQVITYECKEGHTYKVDHGRKSLPPMRRLPAWWCQRMLSYWSKANGGVNVGRHDCPTCKRLDRKL